MKNAKKLMGLVLTVVMLASLAVVPTVRAEEGETAANTNLIVNGGFENVSKYGETDFDWADGWIPNGTGNFSHSEVGTDVEIVEDVKHGGQKALKVIVGTEQTEGRWISYKVENLTPGKVYLASAWIRIDSALIDTPTNYKGAEIRVCGELTSGSGTRIVSSGAHIMYPYRTTDGTWMYLSCPVVLKASETYDATSAYVVLYTSHVPESGKTVYWDDVSFEEVTDVNGDFEIVENIPNGATPISWAKGWNTLNAQGSELDAEIGQTVTLSNEEKHTNSYSLKFSHNGESDRIMRAYTMVSNLVPGRTYQVTGYSYAKGEEKPASQPSILAMDALGDLTLGSGASIGNKTLGSGSANNKWNKMEFSFTAPAAGYIWLTLSSGKISADQAMFFDAIEVYDVSVKFYNEEDVELKNVTAGTINATVKFVNQKEEATDATLVVAVYKSVNGAKQLKSIDIKVMEDVAAKAVGKVTGTVTAEAGDTVKAMLLDSTAALTPITSPFILE